MSGYPDTRSSVGDSAGELVDSGRLVKSGESAFVVLASGGVVGSDVDVVSFAKFLNRSFDCSEIG